MELRFIPDLPDEIQAEWERLGKWKTCSANQVLVCEDSACGHLYWIAQGKVKLVKRNLEGREVILKILQAGDMFGEQGVFLDGAYPYDAVTIEKAEVFIIPVHKVREMAHRHPRLHWHLSTFMARQMVEGYANIRNLALQDSYGKISSKLYDLCRQFGVSEERGIRINLKMSRHEFASFVGLSRETTSIVLNQLERRKILQLDKSSRQIIVHDLGALADQAI